MLSLERSLMVLILSRRLKPMDQTRVELVHRSKLKIVDLCKVKI